jgi:hypothetical protein
MSISSQVFLRYRAPGHVRFSIPADFLSPEHVGKLSDLLKSLEGVYRVAFFPKQGKLSIRYADGIAQFGEIAHALHQAIRDIEDNTSPPDCCAETGLITPAQPEGALHSFRDTFKAFAILLGGGAAKSSFLPKNAEKHTVEFFTDLLVLYLIKIHWHLLTQFWIKRPWLFRSEWMTTIFLVYLLVRSKRPKA